VGDADWGDDCQGSSGRFDSRHKKPIKAICREFRLSRKVARKVIRSEATEFHYKRRRQSLPRIDPWREQLDALLLANEERPTVQLADFGQPTSSSSVGAARNWSASCNTAFATDASSA
jgi:hypothetical protein